MKLKQSSSIEDIYAVNLRSASSRSGICICELHSLDKLVGMKRAEAVRCKLLENKVKTRQLTNLRVLSEWTGLDDFVAQTMEVRFIPKSTFTISYEILVFDDVVAIYRTLPEISYLEIKDITHAKATRQLFEALWLQAKNMTPKNSGAARIES